MARPAAHLTIGQLAERSGVATSALRFYESRGLIASERTGNQRRYPQAALRRVAFVRSAQRVASRSTRSAALATLPRAGPDEGRLVAPLPELAAPDRGADRAPRAAPRRLDSCIGCGCLSLRTCALNNPGDEAAARGPGAVYLEPGRARRGPDRASVGVRLDAADGGPAFTVHAR